VTQSTTRFSLCPLIYIPVTNLHTSDDVNSKWLRNDRGTIVIATHQDLEHSQWLPNATATINHHVLLPYHSHSNPQWLFDVRRHCHYWWVSSISIVLRKNWFDIDGIGLAFAIESRSSSTNIYLRVGWVVLLSIPRYSTSTGSIKLKCGLKLTKMAYIPPILAEYGVIRCWLYLTVTFRLSSSCFNR